MFPLVHRSGGGASAGLPALAFRAPIQPSAARALPCARNAGGWRGRYRPGFVLEHRAKAGCSWDDGGRSWVDGVDDLGAVDPCRWIDVMPRLSCRSWRWMTVVPIVHHLDGVGVAELMGREPSPHPVLASVGPSCSWSEDGSQC
jgi:hypothetical protein